MKKLASLIVFVVCVQAAYTQHLVTSSYMEHTTVSPKAGIQIGNQFTFNYPGYKPVIFTLGGFYQHEVNTGASEYRKQSEKVFTGFYAEWSLVRISRFSALMNVRTGVQKTGVPNLTNFLITPMLKATFSVSEHISLMSGIGCRGMLSPTYTYGISVKF